METKVVKSCERFLKLWKVYLYLLPEIKQLFVKARLDFSLMGIGMHLENAELIASNEEDALKLMLQVLKKHHKKVLVTIDEITYSKDVAKFSHALSSYSNLDYDIYVLMTGLIDNIKNIKNKLKLGKNIQDKNKQN